MWMTGLVHLFFFAAGVRNSIGVVFLYYCLSRSEIQSREGVVNGSLKRIGWGGGVGEEEHRIGGASVLVLTNKTEHEVGI